MAVSCTSSNYITFLLFFVKHLKKYLWPHLIVYVHCIQVITIQIRHYVKDLFYDFAKVNRKEMQSITTHRNEFGYTKKFQSLLKPINIFQCKPTLYNTQQLT